MVFSSGFISLEVMNLFSSSDYGWVPVVIAIFLSMVIMLIVIIGIHELGHGIAYRAFTGKRVTIYLGSYGDQKKSRKIALGGFDFWILLNIFKWKGGLCVASSSAISPRQRFIAILAGPLASLLLSLILLVIIFLYKPEGPVGAFFTIFCVWSSFVFLQSAVPSGKGIVLSNGGIIYNDGQKLKTMISHKKKPQSYHDGENYLRNGQFREAADIFDNMITNGTKDATVYRMAVGAHIKLKDYNKADQVQKEQIQKIGNLDTIDRINLALLKTLRGNYDEAIPYYKHLLQKDGNNKYNLNNLGYTLNIIGQYEEAIVYTNKAIDMDKNFAYSYSNRAYAKMMLGRWEDGREDNKVSLSIDEHNAYAYRNEGLYLFEKGRYNEALEFFEKAKSLDSSIISIDKNIADAQSKINENLS